MDPSHARARWLLAAHAHAQPAVESRFADVNGTRLHYLSAGPASRWCSCTATPQTSHMWRPLIAELAKTHTVIAPDLRGAGESAKPETRLRQEDAGAGRPRAGRSRSGTGA